MLKYIFIALIVAAVWGVVIWLELPMWIAIAVSGVAFAIVATILIVKWVRARRASKEIERALKAQAEAQAKSARPDLEADIRALQGEFSKAISALKGSRLGARGASSALYSLPWYVIVGPPGVGKSTALRNSGLKFPFLSSRGGVSVQGVGGTRNCEWWMTSEAVILDTAGRYTTEGADREEWFAFLGLLRKYRTRRPINGVMAAVSIADIAEAHPEEVASLAREVRARIDELQERLGVVVPVYLIFTKCDLLPGFVEMFSDLTEAERHQIWGFTLAANNQVDIAGQCTEHFDELTAVLEKRALRRLAEERGAERRDRVHEFPQYVAGLRESMGRFVHELTEGNIYNETPILRGVYMSSGTQEGRPVNRIMSAIAEAFGLRPTLQGATAAPPVDAKSYFLGDIFRKIIFPDFRLTRLNRNRTKRSRIVGNVAGIISVLVAIAIVWLPLISFRQNRSMLTDASTAVAYVEQHVDEDTVDAIQIERIEPLRLVVELLEEYEEDGEPWAMKMGMYQGARVYPRLRDVYADTVRRELMLPTVEEELASLRRFMRRYAENTTEPRADKYGEHFNRLRLYLLLTQPADDGEPGLNEEEMEFAVAMLTMLWERPLRINGDGATLSAIERVARTYLQMLVERPELGFERDTTLVERVREILKRSDRTKAVANALIDSVTGPSLTLKKMVATSAIRNDDRLIRPAFTRKGFETQVEPHFENGMEDLLDPQWVLAPGSEGDLEEAEVAGIMTHYFKAYVQEWRTFIDSIYLHVPKSKDSLDALELLTDLTRTEPYKDLFSNIAWHTQLVDLDAEEGEGGGQGPAGESAVGKAVSRTGEMIIQRQLGRGLSKSGLSRIGITTGVPLAIVRQEAKEHSIRLIADPNQANIVAAIHVTYAFLPLAEFGARPSPAVPEDGAPPPPVDKVPIDEYVDQLKYVRDSLEERMDNPEEKKELEEKISNARKKTKSLLSGEKDTRWASTLEKLLWPPLDLTIGAVAKGVAADKQEGWCNGVVAGFERTVAKGYPFNSTGNDVAMADFASFFEPGKGELWSYYDKALKTAIPLRGTKFERVDQSDTKGKYRANVVNFLNAANEVTQTMFPRGAEGAEVEFDVMIEGAPGIKEISLTVDGEKVRYRNGPQVWGTLTWPGEGTPGASVEAHGFGKSADIERDGEWGLLRLLEKGKVKQVPGTRMFVAQWDFRDEGAGLIQMKFRPKRADTPFFGFASRRAFLSIFRTKHLAVPRGLMVGASKCSGGGGK